MPLRFQLSQQEAGESILPGLWQFAGSRNAS